MMNKEELIKILRNLLEQDIVIENDELYENINNAYEEITYED